MMNYRPLVSNDNRSEYIGLVVDENDELYIHLVINGKDEYRRIPTDRVDGSNLVTPEEHGLMRKEDKKYLDDIHSTVNVESGSTVISDPEGSSVLKVSPHESEIKVTPSDGLEFSTYQTSKSSGTKMKSSATNTDITDEITSDGSKVISITDTPIDMDLIKTYEWSPFVKVYRDGKLQLDPPVRSVILPVEESVTVVDNLDKGKVVISIDAVATSPTTDSAIIVHELDEYGDIVPTNSYSTSLQGGTNSTTIPMIINYSSLRIIIRSFHSSRITYSSMRLNKDANNTKVVISSQQVSVKFKDTKLTADNSLLEFIDGSKTSLSRFDNLDILGSITTGDIVMVPVNSYYHQGIGYYRKEDIINSTKGIVEVIR